MPSQRPLIVPPHATFDADVCSEFGRPAFAWAAGLGGIAAAGGGVVPSLSRRYRGTATSGVTHANGSAKFATAAINWGIVAGSQIVAAQSLCVWCLFYPTSVSGNGTIVQQGYIASGSVNNGWELVRTTTGMNLSVTNNNNTKWTGTTGYLAANQWYSALATANLNLTNAAAYSMIINGALTTSSAATTPTAPTWNGDQLVIGQRAAAQGASGSTNSFAGSIAAVMIWRKSQPQKLAAMLDAKPDLFFWWPGKGKAR